MMRLSTLIAASMVTVCVVMAAREASLEDMKAEGHMAHYVMLSKLEFSSKQDAEESLADIQNGYHTFTQLVQRQNQEAMTRGRDGGSGEMGLAEFSDFPKEIARELFDVRKPTAAQDQPNIIGPLCESRGQCYLFVVFQRYRKQFFSQAWWEVDTFAKEAGMPLSEMIETASSADLLKEKAYSIWPDEHISFKKMKIAQVRADARKIGKVDPSTQPMEKPAKRKSMRYHDRLMKERDILLKQIPESTLEENPEIFAMETDEWVEKGWVTQDMLVYAKSAAETAIPTLASEKTKEKVEKQQHKKEVPKDNNRGSPDVKIDDDSPMNDVGRPDAQPDEVSEDHSQQKAPTEPILEDEGIEQEHVEEEPGPDARRQEL